jgi:hypothetical protein
VRYGCVRFGPQLLLLRFGAFCEEISPVNFFRPKPFAHFTSKNAQLHTTL